MNYAAARAALISEAVRRRLQAHPVLAPLRAAGHDVVVIAGEASLIARAGGHEARVDVERWWEPSLTTRDDHAHALARYLAHELRR